MAGVSVERAVDEPLVARPAREPKGLVRWLLAVAIVVTVVSIGLPLIGIRVFLGTDGLEDFAPWRDTKPYVVRSTNNILGDTYDSGMPVHIEFRRQLSHGHFPKWMSLTSGGAPLGVIPDGGTLSPLNIPYLILPLWYAPAAAKLLEMLAAIGFTFLFLRRIGLSRAAGVLGGLVYVNSGFQVVWTNWPQSHVGALIPALFWTVERAFTKRRPRDAVPIALVVATMFLEGFPAVLAYSLMAAAAYLIVRVVSERPVRIGYRIPGGVFAAIGVVLGTGLAAFQLLPFVFHLHGLNLFYRVFNQALPRYALETLVIPNAFGSPAAKNWFAPTSNYIELQSFLGAAALVLAIAGLVRRRDRDGVSPGVWGFVYGAAAVTAVLIYAGGPALKAIYALPLVGMNWIGRMRALFLFLMSVAAAIGYAAVVDRTREVKRRSPELWVWVLVAISGALLVVHVWDVAHTRTAAGYVLRQCIVPTLAGAAALYVVIKTLSSQVWRRRAAFVFPVLVAIESLAFVLPFWPRVPRSEYYPVTTAHTFLQQNLHGDRLAASDITMYSGTTTVYDIPSVTSHTFQYTEWDDLMKAVDPRAFTDLGPTHAKLAATTAVASSPILDRLDARYFAVDPEDPIFGQQLPPPNAVGTTVLRPGHPVEVRVYGTKIRGVTMNITDRGPEGRRPLITAEVLDARGSVLGSGIRRIPEDFDGGDLSVPIASEPPGGRVRLSVSDTAGIAVRAGSTGLPAVGPIVAGADGLRLAFAGPAVMYERLSVMPRVRWMADARVVGRAADRLSLLEAGVPANTVLLDAPGPPAAGRPGAARLDRDTTDSLGISVDAQGPGYVEIADDLQHGWKASIDGRPAPLVAADHALVAVPTPAGHHVIKVWYHPRGFKVGVLISLASVLLTVAALVVSGRLRHVKEESA